MDTFLAPIQLLVIHFTVVCMPLLTRHLVNATKESNLNEIREAVPLKW